MCTKSLSVPTNLPFPSPKSHIVSYFNPKFLPFYQKTSPFRLHQRTQFPKCHQNPNPNTNDNPSLFISQPQEEDHLRDAQHAISHFLQVLGVSEEESHSIALNSKRYVKMLLDSVSDLEEWSKWKHGEGGTGDRFGDLGFEEKVVYMAKEKGDNGKVAFLESIGLSLSSSMNVARYLSGESLPGLIEKVKYMKNIFFSDSDDKGLTTKNARRMMAHLSIPIDEDLQQTLSLFEKIEARRGGLNMLSSPDASFQYVVESFPRILMLSIESHVRPMVAFLEGIGIPKQQIGSIFLLFPPIILYDIKILKRKALAFEEIGVVGRDLGKMLLKYPWIFAACIQENFKEILLFFSMVKVPKVRIDKAIRSWPHILGCSTSKMKVMIEEFAKFGVTNEKLGQVIAASPQLLLRKPQEFLQVASFFEELGFDQETVGQILGRCPEIFSSSIEKTLKKKVEFLRYVGVCEDYLPRVIRKYPELLVSDIDRTLIPRMNYLMELGISRSDVGFMVRSFSPLLGYSIDEVLRPKYEFLVNTMERPLKEAVDYPRYFSYSLERKIKPRFLFLKRRNIQCSLKDMLGLNDEDFAAKFLDAGEVYIPSSPYHQ
ncbi:hypothetical protein K2173_010808 [Erythroxylum novogranatense]|uniref:Uncharacterized protein n=1 Tax=Erythroxylum novogranatense TaxID=1862640 RepID=A0AAV8SZQ6_9ROSI|nr:hypothetical protein K2173_010808 [Erythroxylum novogranatense]